jgi:hypothetical protein
VSKNWLNIISSSKSYTMWKDCAQYAMIMHNVLLNIMSWLKQIRIVFTMFFKNRYNRISEYLRPLKLLVTKVSAEVGFCSISSHCSTYSVYISCLFSSKNFFYPEQFGIYLTIRASCCKWWCLAPVTWVTPHSIFVLIKFASHKVENQISRFELPDSQPK